MKKFLLVFFSILVLIPLRSSATHVLGGDISYKWISDSTYQILLTIYGNCSGGQPYTSNIGNLTNGTPHIHIWDSTISMYPSNAVDIALSPLIDSIKDISPYCSTANSSNSCQQPNNTNAYNGITRYMYTGTYTFPYRSRGWVIEFGTFKANCANAGGRALCNNFITDSHDNITVMNTLNNKDNNGHNSTPVFTNAKYAYVYSLGVPGTFVENVIDPEGDSLAYYTDSLYETVDNACFLPVIWERWQPGYHTSNPVGPAVQPGTYSFSNTTGNMTFTPTLQGLYAVTTRIVEYRNGKIMGSTLREITLFYLPYSGGIIQDNIDSSSVAGANFIGHDTLTACPGNIITFNARIHDAQGDSITVTYNNNIPGSTISINNNNTSNPLLSFNWNSTGAQSNIYTVTANFLINSCPLPSYSSHTYTIIFNNLQASPNTSICLGSTTQLSVAGGNNYTWSVLPGGAPISSLSCITCANPVASPGITTSYVVSTTQQNGCTIRDTVVVTVNSVPAKPTPTSNSPVCANDSLRLYAGAIASSYRWTGPGGFNSVSQNPVIYNIQTPNTGWYHVKAMNGGCVSAPDSTYVTVTAAPKYPEITGNSPICTGSTLMLSAQSNLGVNYQWSGPNGFISTQQNITINSAGPSNAGLYSVVAFYPANAACKSPTGTYNMVVTPGVIAGFSFSKDTICKGDIVYISYIANGDSALSFKYNGGVAQDTVLTNPMPVKFPSAGTETITLYAYDTGCTAIITHNIHVLAPPPATFTAPPVCFGMPVTVIANNVYDADVTFTWNFGQATVLSGSGQGPYILQYGQPGVYPITLVTKNPTCTSPLVANDVVVDAIPDATITTSNINNICSEDTIRFDAPIGYGYHYQWQQPLFFANDTLPSTYAFVKYAERLYLTVIDNYGCKASDSVDIAPHPCCIVSLPNAFTPNGDGKNDVFRIITIGHHDIAYFRVFNRWGQLVFSSTNESQGWDGKANGGVPSDGGTYYYALRYRCVDGEYFEQKGEVVLVR